MVNADKIKGKTRELRMTDDQVAKYLNIHPSTYHRKLNHENGETFTLKQLFGIASLLDFSKEEAADIFFGNKLA